MNEGFTNKMHRELALKLLKNIQFLKEKGDLEEEEQDITSNENNSNTMDFKNRFIKSEVLTVEIPKKSNKIILQYFLISYSVEKLL